MANVNINETAMLANVSLGSWVARKYDKKASVEVTNSNNATTDAGRFNKQLIAKDEINKIVALDQQIRLYHYSVTLPWLDDGARILPAKKYMEYSDKMREYRNKREGILSDFFDKYEALKEQAKLFLGDLFNEQDYPSLDKIKRKFSFDVRIFPLPISSDFRVNIHENEVKKIRNQIEEQTKVILDNSIRDLYSRLYKVVKHLAEKIVDTESQFKNSIIGNICELCDLLKDLNISEDKEFENTRKRIEDSLCKVDPQDLRDDKEFRQKTADEAQSILDAMSGYL